MSKKQVKVKGHRLEPLEQALAIVGSQEALARKIGVQRSRVSLWLNGYENVPLKYTFAISSLTNIHRHAFRPDMHAFIGLDNIEKG